MQWKKQPRRCFPASDPAEARDNLEVVIDSGRFNCSTEQFCDRFYYILGLAYELSGDLRDAIDAYIEFVVGSQQKPYTTMARYRLHFRPPPTPTNTRRVQQRQR